MKPDYIVCSKLFYHLLRKIVCKQVPRSKGKGRGNRVKWVRR